MYFNGFIIAALMPPAVVIIAYNMLLRGNQEAALIAEVIAYILSLCIIPVTVLLLFGQTVDIAYLAWLIFIMIGLPIIVSRFLHFKCTAFNYCKIAINICMFLLFFILVGINQATILNGELIVFWLIIAGLLKTYLIPAIIFLAMKCPPFKRKEKITYALFGSVKNLGTGAVIALSLFGPEAALVSVILMLTEIPFYIVIGRLKTADICQA
jgi:predicted Na+-dependent transporter